MVVRFDFGLTLNFRHSSALEALKQIMDDGLAMVRGARDEGPGTGTGNKK